MANIQFAVGNNLIRGDAAGEGVKIGLGSTKIYGWADLKGHYVYPPTGTTAGTFETFATGITRLGFNATDIIITELHAEHIEVQSNITGADGRKYLHPHPQMATGATASGSNLVLTHVIMHSYGSIGAGETRGASPAPITITQTITIAELNAIGSGNNKAFDIEIMNNGGTGGKLNGANLLPDDMIFVTTTVTTMPTITGGTSAKVALLPMDVHREVIDGSGTKFKDRVGGTFYGNNA